MRFHVQQFVFHFFLDSTHLKRLLFLFFLISLSLNKNHTYSQSNPAINLLIPLPASANVLHSIASKQRTGSFPQSCEQVHINLECPSFLWLLYGVLQYGHASLSLSIGAPQFAQFKIMFIPHILHKKYQPSNIDGWL